MELEKLIITALNKTGRRNIKSLTDEMKHNRFFTNWSASHHRWDGGTAEHSWQVYQFMLYLRDNPNDKLKQYQFDYSTLSDSSIAIVGLLHDLGKIKGNYLHNINSVKILLQHNVQVSNEELSAILFHMSVDNRNINFDRTVYASLRQFEHKAQNPLLALLEQADHISSGTAWNSSYFIKGQSQKKDKPQTTIEARRRNAYDRTIQMLEYKMYCDHNGQFQHLSNDGRDLNRTFYDCELHTLPTGSEDTNIIIKNGDFIEEAKLISKADNTDDLCMVIGGDGISPARGFNSGRPGDEKTLMLCSNMSKAFANYELGTSKRADRHYITRRDIQDRYPLDRRYGGVFVKNVTIIRDGEPRGLRQIQPWDVNVVVVRGAHLHGNWNGDTESIMTEKIKTLFRIAYWNGQKRLVIPALGADGSWKNPQNHIARLLFNILRSSEFKSVFKEVYFIVPNEYKQIYHRCAK